ncbi:MAG: NAD(P)H-hydrate dehydratase [Phycisphaerales bacterium]
MDDPPSLPARSKDAHKGTAGTVGIVGGCAAADQPRMIGAPALAALGALRAGAGLAKIAAPGPILTDAVSMCPSATGIALPTDSLGDIVAHEAAGVLDALADAADCLVVGPGLGSGEGVAALVVRAVGQQEAPVVLDADGLNTLAGVAHFASEIRARLIVTPHPGEFRRLAEPLKITQRPTDTNERPAAAERMAQALGCVVVLKGAGTVVSDGHRTWTCAHGHPCLATAGTGDVLSGVIAGMVAQFAAPPPIAPGVPMPVNPAKPFDLYECARVGVLVHARAGERWARRHGASAGLIATELAAEIPGAVEAERSDA